MLDSYIKEILNSNFVIDRTKISEKQGVYLIHQEEEIIYVGEGVNLHKRINSQHISGSKTGKSSAFRRSLCDRLKKHPGPEIREWVIHNCKFKYIEIDDIDLCHLVEKALIYKLRPNHDLLNKQ